jgi:hypothetical protein
VLIAITCKKTILRHSLSYRNELFKNSFRLRLEQQFMLIPEKERKRIKTNTDKKSRPGISRLSGDGYAKITFSEKPFMEKPGFGAVHNL